MNRHIQRLIELAHKNGWDLREHQAKNTLLIFVKDTRQINIWYTKMTVGTLLNHPKQGRNMLYRRNVSIEELEKLFNNPREHVGKGYRAATHENLINHGYKHPEDGVYKVGRIDGRKPSLKSRLRYLFTGKL